MINTFNNLFFQLQRLLKIDVHYFLTNGLWSSLADIINAMSGLALVTLFARLAPQAVFGSFQFIVSATSLLGFVAIKGLDTVIIRDVAQKKDGIIPAALKLRFRWSLLGTPIMLIISLYYYQQSQPSLALAFFITAFLLPWYYTALTWPAILKGKERFKQFSHYYSLRSIVTLVIVATSIVLSHGNLVIIVTTFFITQLLINSLLTYWTSKTKTNDSLSYNWQQYAYFLTKINLFKLIVANLDKVLIALLLSPVSLAVYSVAIVIPNYIQLVVKSLFQTTAPRLSRRHNISFHELSIATILGLAFSVFTLLLVHFLLPLLFGTEYHNALLLGYITSFSLIFHPTAQLLINYINMSAKKKALLISNTICPSLKLLLLLVLVSRWQLIGFSLTYAAMGIIWTIIPLSVLRINWSRRTLS